MDKVICEYCGPKTKLPKGYDKFGTPHSCLQKGVGIGKYTERRKWEKDMGYEVEDYIPKCPKK